MIEMMQKGMIGTLDYCCPQYFFGTLLMKGLLTNDKSKLNTRERVALMMTGSCLKLYNEFKPLLIALFEYYLYETYPADMICQT